MFIINLPASQTQIYMLHLHTNYIIYLYRLTFLMFLTVKYSSEYILGFLFLYLFFIKISNYHFWAVPSWILMKFGELI